MHFAEHVVVVALGISLDGTKIPLAVAEGSTENATLVTDLLVGRRDRGLEVGRPTLVVIDGSKALASAVRAVSTGRSSPVPTAQDPQRRVQAGKIAGLDRGDQYARRLPDDRRPGRPGGQMVLRWCAAGMGEAAKQVRRVNGHPHLPVLRKALEAEAAE